MNGRAVLSVAPARAAWLGWSLGGSGGKPGSNDGAGEGSCAGYASQYPCFVRKPGWQTAMLPSLLENFSAELAQDYERTLTRFLSLQVRGSEYAAAVLKNLRMTLLAQARRTRRAGCRTGNFACNRFASRHAGHRVSDTGNDGRTGHPGAGERRQGNAGLFVMHGSR